MQAVKNERGSVLVFVTLMIVVLLVMVGLGLDTGHLTYVRNQGQAAVDAAALAAVSGLPSRNPNQVQNRATAFNSTNNYVESPTNPIGTSNISYVQYDFTTNTITNYAANINNANGVRVALEQANGGGITTPMFLTPLLNLLGISTPGTKEVNVSAVATIISKPSIPIALWENICPQYPGPYLDSTITQTVDIKMQHPDQKTGNENSCWTTFLDCSSGAPDIKAGFQVAQSCSGGSINGNISIGVPICQNRGQVNTVLGEAIDFFTAHGGLPNSNWWVIPVIGGGGNCDPTNPSPIKTWAKIRPILIDKTGDPKYIRAEVGCGDRIPEDLSSSLCFTHRLVREKAKNM
jgi:Flp pilus assembly protein TadG